MLDPNHPHSPTCPNSLAKAKYKRRGRTMGREGRLGARLSAKLISIHPPKAGTPHFASQQNAAANFAGPASGVRSAVADSYASKPGGRHENRHR